MIELNHLKYFYEVAKIGSFTGASRTLRISQSSLSKAVALLEDRQGVKLFNRTKKGIVLTSLGVEVFKKSQELFAKAAEIENLCLGQANSHGGPLKLGASDHTINYLLAKASVKLKNLYPEIIPSVYSATPNEIVALIMSGEIEFGLFFTQVQLPAISYRPLMEVEMSLVCSSKLVSSTKAKLNLVDSRKVLKKYGLISSIGSQYHLHPSKPIMDMLGEKPAIVMETNSQEAQKQFCIEGGGVAFLANFMVEKEIRENILVSLKLDTPLKITLYLASRKDYPISRNAQALLDILNN